MEIQNSINKLKTIRQTLNTIADSYSSLTPKESVSVQLHADGEDLTAYKVKVVNTNTGNKEYYDIPANGLVEFEIKYDTTYEVHFPIIGAYITPSTRTFTAQRPIRKIEVSYVMDGVCGLDEQGNRYSLEQIEALEDKSIIKYGGYTDNDLENAVREDGTKGCGFMWDLNQEDITAAWASQNVEFSQELLPFVTKENAISYCDGEAYTQYILSEGARLLVETPAASTCTSKVILVGKIAKKGYLPAYGQLKKLHVNQTSFSALYNVLGLTIPNLFSSKSSWTSCQYVATHAVDVVYINNSKKTYVIPVLVVFNL